MDLVVIGVPYALNQHGVGVGAAPAAWKDAGLMERLAPYVSRAIWVSLPPPPEAEGPEHQQLVTVGRKLAETVRAARAAGAVPLVLGGDCLLTALGTMAGLQSAGERPGVVWFDAHGDSNTHETSPSGLLVGMPLAMLAGRGDLRLAKDIGIQQPTPEWHIMLAGARQLDPGEATALEDGATTLWTARDLMVAGAEALGRSVESWPPIYLHVDLDVIDPSDMPAVVYPAPDGLAAEMLNTGIESVMAEAPVSAICVASFDPTRDVDGRGLDTGMLVIEAAVRTLSI